MYIIIQYKTREEPEWQFYVDAEDNYQEPQNVYITREVTSISKEALINIRDQINSILETEA